MQNEFRSVIIKAEFYDLLAASALEKARLRSQLAEAQEKLAELEAKGPPKVETAAAAGNGRAASAPPPKNADKKSARTAPAAN